VQHAIDLTRKQGRKNSKEKIRKRPAFFLTYEHFFLCQEPVVCGNWGKPTFGGRSCRYELNLSPIFGVIGFLQVEPGERDDKGNMNTPIAELIAQHSQQV
jgi:hypothetical protein